MGAGKKGFTGSAGRMGRMSSILVLVGLIGCSGYRPGSLPDGPPVDVYLEPVQNEAYISGITPLFQRDVRRIALQSRHLNLVADPDQADLTAYVRLADLRERQVAFLEDDSGQAVSSRLTLSAVLTVSEPGGATPLIDEETLSVNSPVYSDPQTAFSNPVDQTKPFISRNLASSVVLAIELAGRKLQADRTPEAGGVASEPLMGEGKQRAER